MTAAPCAIRPAAEPRRRQGFTLLELLVVMGILFLLASMLLPMLYRVRRMSIRTRAAQDLQTISSGLEHFKLDYGDYPRPSFVNPTNEASDGSACLGIALIGTASPQANGDTNLVPGFQPNGPTGRIYGPYIQASARESQAGGFHIDAFGQIGNRRGSLILYFPATSPPVDPSANQGGDPTQQGGYVLGPYSYYDPTDAVYLDSNSNPHLNPSDSAYSQFISSMRALLGDIHVVPNQQPPVYNTDGVIEPGMGEHAYIGPYLLWDSGVNPYYGLVDDNGNNMPISFGSVAQCDDVTNFR